MIKYTFCNGDTIAKNNEYYIITYQEWKPKVGTLYCLQTNNGITIENRHFLQELIDDKGFKKYSNLCKDNYLEYGMLKVGDLFIGRRYHITADVKTAIITKKWTSKNSFYIEDYHPVDMKYRRYIRLLWCSGETSNHEWDFIEDRVMYDKKDRYLSYWKWKYAPIVK